MSKQLKLGFLRTARTLGMFGLFRMLTRSRTRILCYHGGAIGDESDYNAKLFLPKNIFEKRMRWLQEKGFNVVPLDGAIHGAAQRVPAPLQTVITFDDGWYSTLSELTPVLEQLGMPSTLYLCTSHFLEGTPVASVTVRYIIWKSSQTSACIDGLGPEVDGMYDLSAPAARERLAQNAIAWMRECAPGCDHAYAALERFAESLGVRAGDLQLRSRRFQYASAGEIRNLASQGCAIELHGHVHHYPKGDPVALKHDLEKCSSTIQEMGLPVPRHYCYPSGSFDADAPSPLSQLGIVSATTCIPGLITKAEGTETYFLPRFLDGADVDMLEFEAEMSGFSEFMRRCAGRA